MPVEGLPMKVCFQGKELWFNCICSVLEDKRQSFYLKLWFIQKEAVNLVLHIFTEHFL